MRPAKGAFTLEVVHLPAQVADAAAEGAVVKFPVTLSRAVPRSFTLRWTTGRPNSAAPVFESGASGTVARRRQGLGGVGQRRGIAD